MCKYKIGDIVYFEPYDMFGTILEIDEDNEDDMIFYYISFPIGETWVDESFLTKEERS